MWVLSGGVLLLVVRVFAWFFFGSLVGMGLGCVR